MWILDPSQSSCSPFNDEIYWHPSWGWCFRKQHWTEEVFLPEITDNKEEATVAAAFPEVSPRKDDIYLPTQQEDSDDSNMSGLDNEHQGEIKCEKPQDDTKYIVFKQKLFILFKYCLECGAAVMFRSVK